LIVDDDDLIVRTLGRIIGDRAEVENTGNAAEALMSLETARFDVVLTDYDMPPGKSGVALLLEVRARFPTIRRLLMSGRDAEHFEKECATGLIQGFLAKPFRRRDVLTSVGIA
jgi:YesN/AraC family two-component response regulator